MNKMRYILRQRDFWRLMYWFALTVVMAARVERHAYIGSPVLTITAAITSAVVLGITLGEGPRR